MHILAVYVAVITVQINEWMNAWMNERKKGMNYENNVYLLTFSNWGHSQPPCGAPLTADWLNIV